MKRSSRPKNLSIQEAARHFGVPASVVRVWIKGKPATKNEAQVEPVLQQGVHWFRLNNARHGRIIIRRDRTQRELDRLKTLKHSKVTAPAKKALSADRTARVFGHSWRPYGVNQMGYRVTLSLDPRVHEVVFDDLGLATIPVVVVADGTRQEFTIYLKGWTDLEVQAWRFIKQSHFFFAVENFREGDRSLIAFRPCFQYCHLRYKYEQTTFLSQVAMALRLEEAKAGPSSAEPEPTPAPTPEPIPDPTPAVPPSGYQSRLNRGVRQLALECPSERVRQRVCDFYRMYGHPTGLSQSPFLVNLLIDAMTKYDAERGGKWLEAATDT